MSDFAARLRNLDFSGDVAAQLALPNERELLDRCALVSAFDKSLYESICSGLDTVPSFEMFVELPEIQQSSTTPGSYWLRDSERFAALHRWEQRTDRREWCETLLNILPSGDEHTVLDRMMLLLGAFPEKGRTEYRQLFEKADEADDLPLCGALVEALKWRVEQNLVDRETLTLWQQCRARYGARALYWTEYKLTASYINRPRIESRLVDFATGAGGKWMFHIHGAGGMGKSAMLRWLVARKLVREKTRVPVVWLDFDYLDVLSIAAAPWLVGLPLGAQIDEQIESPIFSTLISSSALDFCPLLFRAMPSSKAARPEDSRLRSASVAQFGTFRSNSMRCGVLTRAPSSVRDDVRADLINRARSMSTLWHRFAQAIATVPSERPIVVVLDTLEEASLGHSYAVLDVIKLFSRMREEVAKRGNTDLRLILSGRYRLGDRHLPELMDEFGEQIDFLDLPAFDDPESVELLERELPAERRALIAPIVARARGIPFELKLYARWAVEDRTLTAAEIASPRGEAGTVYLIERVINRIRSQPLRWVVRYGVIPRALTLEFLRDVMAEPLRRALSGSLQREGADLANSAVEQDVWKPEPDSNLDLDRLWHEQLLPYASDKGWLQPDSEDLSVLRFRNDIEAPMRALLKPQKVAADLHRRSMRYFQEKAANEPSNWAQWTIEALYHAAQLESDETVKLIKEAFDDPHVLSKPDVRLRIAQSLLEDDFEVLRPHERAHVEYRAAEALGDGNDYRYSFQTAVGTTMRSHLTRAIESRGEQNQALLPAFAGIWGDAWDPPVGTVVDRLRLNLLLSENVVNPEMAIQYLQYATEAASELGGNSPIPAAVPFERSGAAFFEAGDIAKAQACYESGAIEYANAGLPQKARQASLRSGHLLVLLARFDDAYQTLNAVIQAESTNAEAFLLMAWLELSCGQPGRSIRYIETANSLKLTSEEQITAELYAAEAYSQRMLLEPAEARYQRIISAPGTSRSTIIDALTGLYSLYRFHMRALEIPPFYSSLRSETVVDWPVEAWRFVVEDRLEFARFVAYSGFKDALPSDVVVNTLLVASLVPLPEQRWTEFWEALLTLPRSARWLQLDEPALLLDPPNLPAQVVGRLKDLFYCEPEGPIERGWCMLYYAEFLGWLGEPQEAAKLLAKELPKPTGPNQNEAWRFTTYKLRRRLEQRLRGWGADIEAEPDAPDWWVTMWGHTPFRCAAVLVENAERAVEAGKPEIAARSLELARPMLDSVNVRTDFHKRFEDLTSTGAATAGASSIDFEAVAKGPLPVVAMRKLAGRLAVKTNTTEQLLSGAENPCLDALLRSGDVPRFLAELLLRNPESAIADLREVLEDAASGMPGTKRRLLRLPLGPLACAPWEMATRRFLPPPVRLPSGWFDEAVLRMMVEHQVWRAQHSDLDEFRHRAPTDPKPLYMPSGQAFRQGSAFAAYQDLQVWLTRLGSPRIDAPNFLAAIASTDFDLLYLTGHIAESRFGEPVIVCGDSFVTRSEFYNALKGRKTESFPGVILDVPKPLSEAEVYHQLLLRNWFAQALLDTGAVSYVLATGLGDDTDQQTLHHTIRNAFQVRRLREELFDEIHRLRDELCFTATALFTSNKEDLLLPPNAAEPA